MSGDAQAVLREALSLPEDDRADIAAELIASLDERDVDDLDAVRELWARELESRARRALSGASNAGENWQVLRQRLADDLRRG